MADGATHFRYYKFMIPFAVFLGIVESWIIGLYFYQYLNPILFFIFYCFNYFLGSFIDPDNDIGNLTSADHRVLRFTKRINPIIGLFGACHISYWFIYSYLVGLTGGHRSWSSHSWILSTILRVIYFNIPLFVFLNLICNFGILNWNWEINGIIDIIKYLYLDFWAIPYLLSQYLSWQISDGTHLLLDTKWAKNFLYIPINNYKENDHDRNNNRNR